MAVDADQISNEVSALVAAHAGVPVQQVGPATRLWHDLMDAISDREPVASSSRQPAPMRKKKSPLRASVKFTLVRGVATPW